MFAARGEPDPTAVVLRDANAEAAAIFLGTRMQLIMGPGGPVALNHLAVYAAMDLYGVTDRQGCFAKVLRLGDWWLEHLTKKDGE